MIFRLGFVCLIIRPNSSGVIETILTATWKGIYKIVTLRNLSFIGELPYRGVTGLVELHELLLEGARLEKPTHCSEEL